MNAATPNPALDVAIVGGGAAGLATAIFAARRCPNRRIAVIDGASELGAKILISGGGRCNVTNRTVTANDYFGGSRNTIRRVLAALPIDATILFFEELGVSLHEEEFGKLFPNSNSARTVLAALLAECDRRNVRIVTGTKVTGVRREGDWFALETKTDAIRTRAVVLATGGRSVAKTGSDGTGYALAESLGHTLIPTTPALSPLVFETGGIHTGLSGIAQDVELSVFVDEKRTYRRIGPMLWTHFGVSGPQPMNVSRIWHRAQLEGRQVAIMANFLPARTLETAESELLAWAAEHPKASLATALSAYLPQRVVEALLRPSTICGISTPLSAGQPQPTGMTSCEPFAPMAHLTREARRAALRRLLEWRLPVIDSRGFGVAEVTAGGIPLTELDSATMESRVCPGVFLVGEILDVDGRIGGFNFQWAWCSAAAAAIGLDKHFRRSAQLE